MREAAEQVWPPFWMPAVDKKGQGRVEVGIGKDDLRGFAAQLQRHRHHVLCRRSLHQRAGGDRAGEGDMLHPRMARKRRSGLRPQPRHHVQRPCGQACLRCQMGKGQRGEAGFFCGFQHAGIAHRQRRANRASDDLHRIVPGHDMAGDAKGFAQGEDGVTVHIGDGVAGDLVRRATVEFAVARQRHRIGARLGQRLADVHHLQRCKPVHALGYHLAEAGQDTATLGGAHLAPCALLRGLRCGNGGVDIGRLTACYLADFAAIGGVCQRQGGAILCGAPLSGDEAQVRVEPEGRGVSHDAVLGFQR